MPHIFQARPEMAAAQQTRAALQKMPAFLNCQLAD